MLTIPNVISTARLFLVPLFLWLLFGKDDPALAGWVLFLVASSDWVDGYLARRLDQVTELGKILDPLADRLAVATAVVAGWIADVLPPWFAAILIAREVFVGIMAIYVLAKGGRQVEVKYLGKVATAMVYSAVTWFYLAEGYDWDWLAGTAYVVGSAGLIFYYAVLVDYLRDIATRFGSRGDGSAA